MIITASGWAAQETHAEPGLGSSPACINWLCDPGQTTSLSISFFTFGWSEQYILLTDVKVLYNL